MGLANSDNDAEDVTPSGRNAGMAVAGVNAAPVNQLLLNERVDSLAIKVFDVGRSCFNQHECRDFMRRQHVCLPLCSKPDFYVPVLRWTRLAKAFIQ